MPAPAPHPLGLVVGDQLVDGGRLGDLEQDGLSWRVGAGGDVAEGAGRGAAPTALALHPHAGRHALGARLGEAGDVLGEGEHLGVPLTLLRLVRGGVAWRRGEKRGTGVGSKPSIRGQSQERRV